MEKVEGEMKNIKLYYNDSNIIQAVTDGTTNSCVQIPPKFLYPEIVCSEPYGQSYDSLVEAIDHRCQMDDKPIFIRRGSSYGDLLMLIPIINLLHEKTGRDIIVSCNNNFHNIFKFVKGVVGTCSLCRIPPASKYSIGITFDGILERDRTIFDGAHRLDIYGNMVFGELFNDIYSVLDVKKAFKLVNIPQEIGESVTRLINEVVGEVQETKTLLGIALQANRQEYSLPGEVISYLVAKIQSRVRRYIPVSLTKEKPYGAFPVGQNIGMLGVLEALKRCSLLITVDTGIYWVSHYTGTPTILVLNSNNTTSNITSHNQYHPKAISMIVDYNQIHNPTLWGVLFNQIKEIER